MSGAWDESSTPYHFELDCDMKNLKPEVLVLVCPPSTATNLTWAATQVKINLGPTGKEGPIIPDNERDETGGWQVHGLPELENQFKTTLVILARPCHKIKNLH